MKNIFVTLLCCAACIGSYGQSTVFTPTNSGGFENGGTFTANNWTSVNGPANQWAVGNGSVNVGVRGAYIGTATTFVGTNTPAINHFYRTGGSTVPAGAFNVFLTFRYRQPVVDPGNDSFIVSVTSNANPVPVAGVTPDALHTRVYQNTATAHAGYVEVGPLDLTSFAGTTFRLVYSHINNGVSPIGIPAVDSISLNYCNSISGSMSMCEGGTVNLTCLTPSGNWSSSNPAVATIGTPTGTTTIVTGIAAGTAIITHMAGSCTATAVVTVNALPAPITGSLSVCLGSTSALTSASTGGTWASSAPAVATISASGIVSGLSVGTTNITYTLPTTCRAFAQATVNGLPTVANVTGGGSYCASGSGISVGLDASAPGNDYSLSDGSSVVATLPGTGSSLNFGTFTSAGTYNAVATNTTTGCSRNMSGSATITITTPVVPSVTITPGSSLICESAAASFVATPVNGGTTPSYQWFVNGIPAGTGTTYGYVPAIGDIVSVTLHAGGICAVPDTANTALALVVTPLSVPTIAISVGPSNPSCLGQTVTFSATAGYGGTGATYLWNKNGINVATGTGYSYVPVNGDVVYCQLTSSFACRTTDFAISSSITMMVAASAPLPVVIVSAAPGTTITPGTPVTLTATTVGGGVVSYLWLLNGTPIAGATDNFYVSDAFVNGDIVTCKVTNSDPCGHYSLKSVVISTSTTGIHQTESDRAVFTISPNPNRGNFTITGFNGSAQTISVKVFNMLGQSVYTGNIEQTSQNVNEKISLPELPAGMYLLDISTASGKSVLHFQLID